jgi:hypothetical protein
MSRREHRDADERYAIRFLALGAFLLALPWMALGGMVLLRALGLELRFPQGEAGYAIMAGYMLASGAVSIIGGGYWIAAVILMVSSGGRSK